MNRSIFSSLSQCFFPLGSPSPASRPEHTRQSRRALRLALLMGGALSVIGGENAFSAPSHETPTLDASALNARSLDAASRNATTLPPASLPSASLPGSAPTPNGSLPIGAKKPDMAPIFVMPPPPPSEKPLPSEKIGFLKPSDLDTPSPDLATLPYLAIPDFNAPEKDRRAGRWGQAVQQAIASAVAHGGGTVRLLAHPYHIDKRDLVVPPGVTIEGAARPVMKGDWRALPYALVLDPGHTVRLDSGAALRRLAIIPSTLTVPRNAASMSAELARWAQNGTAVTIDGATTPQLVVSGIDRTQLGAAALKNQHLRKDPHASPSSLPSSSLSPDGATAVDIDLEDLFILGFRQAVSVHRAARLHVSGLYGDALNGVSLDDCHDSCRLNDVRWAPYFTENTPYAHVRLAIGALTASPDTASPAPPSPDTARFNDGKKGTAQAHPLRATLPEGRRYPLLDGWPVTVREISSQTKSSSNAPQANASQESGVYTLKKISDRVFDLEGSVWRSEDALSGRTLRLDLDLNSRPGDAFRLTRSENTGFYGTSARGYRTAYRFGEGVVSPVVVNGVAEGQRTPGQTGLLAEGDATGLQWLGGTLTGMQTPLLLASTGQSTLLDLTLDARGKSCLTLEKGLVQLMGASCTGGAPLLIGAEASGPAALFGNRFGKSPIVNRSRFRPLVMDATTGLVSGLNIPRVSTLSALPPCTADRLGDELYVTSLRKPAERHGAGTGGRVVCTAASPQLAHNASAQGEKTEGAYSWFSQFTGARASE